MAQNLLLTTAFYWDRTPETRASRPASRGRPGDADDAQAGVYSSVLHYLKAVQAAGTDDAKDGGRPDARDPVNDMFATNGKIREDGRMVHDMYLMQVKTPKESTGEWDLYKLIATVPGDEAFRPLAEGGCPLVKAAAK